MPEPSDYFSAFGERLAASGIEFALIGALAANAYRAEPRLTTDVDFLVRALNGFHTRLVDEGFEIKAMTDSGEPEPYLVLIRGNDVRVDLIVAETPFQYEALDRAVDGIITVEDVLVHKLLAWRPRDRDDVASILAAGHDLDTSYIERWVEVWEIGDRWAQAQRPFD